MRQLYLLLLACPLLVTACSPSGTTTDGGTDDAEPTVDGGQPACPEAGPDPGLVSANAPVGTQLQAGNDLSIRGVTSDGYVVYSDDVALTLHAVPLAGGPVQDLGALGTKFWVTLTGSIVFIWANVNDVNVGALSTWSAVTGLHAISPASFGIDAAASSTGDRIVYVDHVNTPAKTGDIFAASSDGSGATKLVSSAYIDGCFPQMAFVGTYAVATHCEAPPEKYLTHATLSSFAASTWAKMDLATNVTNYWATDWVSKVLTTDGAGVVVIPVAGGTATTIDAAGFLGTLTPDGNAALYSTKSGEMRRSLVTSPAPTTLVASGFGGFWSLSPDQKWTIYFGDFGSDGTDLFLTSAVSPTTPTTLSAVATGTVSGDGFTLSSSHALFTTTIDPCNHGVGTLQALAIGTTSPRSLGQRVWADWALIDSKILFNDNFAPDNAMRFGRADIEWVDLAQAAAPTRLVDRADAVIGLTKDKLVYVWSAQPGPLAGLYVTPLP